MGCDKVNLPGGGFMIVCSRGRGKKAPRCFVCTAPSSRQCDGTLRTPGATCDRYLCLRHATRLGPERDLCPDCVEMAERARVVEATFGPTSLEVWTARIDQPDPDGFDITRLSGGDAADAFAPSWPILSPALAAREKARELRTLGRDFFADADKIEADAWRVYRPQFLAEMLVRTDRPVPKEYRGLVREALARGVTPAVPAWKALLARPRVCLKCYCGDAQCHRVLVAQILGRLGARVRGELPRAQLSLLPAVEPARG